MPYSNTWNSAYESSPADLDLVSDGASKMRSLKIAIRERMQKNHYWDPSGTDADHGEHLFCTLRKQTSKPAAEADKGYVYTKVVGGHAELFYENEAGTEIQLTSDSGLNAPSAFPSGTKMVFYQDTAPIGWTIDTSLNDKLLFITKGSAAGGQTGGSSHSTGTWQQPDHVLTIAEMPAHTHTVVASHSGGLTTAYSGGSIYNGTDSLTTSSTGGGGAHNHGAVWRPAAYCAIIASKN